MTSTARIVTFVAFVVGALAWILPPHFLGVEHYPETTWPLVGDAIWYARPLISMPICAIIGFVYGLLVPERWRLALVATWWIVPFNLFLDVAKFPTSHNLWFFEIPASLAMNLPALFGAWAGKRLVVGAALGPSATP
jgi:hypothetical protein